MRTNQPQIYPWKITIDPPQVPPGEDVHVTIDLNQSTTSPLQVALASTPVGAFENMPDSVVVRSGQDQYSLTLTVSASQSGVVVLTASTPDGEAAGALVVPTVTSALSLAA